MRIIISFVLTIMLLVASFYFQGKGSLLQWLCLGGAVLFLAYLFINRPKSATEEQKKEIIQKILNEQI